MILDWNQTHYFTIGKNPFKYLYLNGNILKVYFIQFILIF